MIRLAGGRAATAGVLLAWCLLGVGDSLHAGYYTPVALALVTAGFVVVAAVIASGTSLAVPDRWMLVVAALVGLGAAIANPAKRYLYVHGGDLHAIEVLSIATAATVVLACYAAERWQRPAWIAVLALATATGITTIVLISNPNIDVWDLLQQSSTGLLHGDDMYRQHWHHSTGLQNVYPYLPGTTLIVAPFRWVFGDVRYGLLTAAVLGAWFIKRLAPPQTWPLAALLLVCPAWPYLINRSWTEPLLVAALAGAILAMRQERSGWAIVSLAVALACKQHIVLLLPLFIFWPSFGVRRTIASSGLAALVVLPWFIAGPRDLWHDVVHANLALGVKTDSLSLPGLFLTHGHRIGFGLVAVLMLAAYALVLWRLPRTPSGLALGCALVMWAFDLANKQTYFNHYQLPLGLLLVAVAAADRAFGQDRSVASGP